jgi:hypothetical protein
VPGQPRGAAQVWRYGLAPRSPTLADLWSDWVARWVNVGLAEGEEVLGAQSL